MDQEQERDQSFFTTAPDEILLRILLNIDANDLISTSQVNHNLSMVSKDYRAWQSNIQTDFNLSVANNSYCQNKYLINHFIANLLHNIKTEQPQPFDYAKKARGLLSSIPEQYFAKNELGWKLYIEGVLDCVNGQDEPGYQKILTAASQHDYCEAKISSCFMGNQWNLNLLPVFCEQFIPTESKRNQLTALKTSGNISGLLGKMLLELIDLHNLDAPNLLVKQYLYQYKIIDHAYVLLATRLHKNYPAIVFGHGDLDPATLFAFDPTGLFIQQLRRFKTICNSEQTDEQKRQQKLKLALEGCWLAARDLQHHNAIATNTYNELFTQTKQHIANRIIALYSQAHRAGIAEASEALAKIYANGLGDFDDYFTPNPTKAKEILATSVKRGDSGACYLLGTLSLPNINVAQQQQYLTKGQSLGEARCSETLAQLMIDKQTYDLAELEHAICAAQLASRAQKPDSLLMLAGELLTGTEKYTIAKDTKRATQLFDQVIAHNPNRIHDAVETLWHYHHYAPAVARLLYAFNLHQGIAEAMALHSIFNTGQPYLNSTVVEPFKNPTLKKQWHSFFSICMGLPAPCEPTLDELSKSTLEFTQKSLVNQPLN